MSHLPAREPLAPEPQRLVHDPEIGPVLDRANREYKSGLDEHAAFQRLSERLEPRARSLGAWPRATLGVAFGLAAGVGLVWAAFGERAPGIAFGPEVTVARVRPNESPSPELEAPPRAAPALAAPARDTGEPSGALHPPPTASPSLGRQSLEPSQPELVRPTPPAPAPTKNSPPRSSAPSDGARSKSLPHNTLRSTSDVTSSSATHARGADAEAAQNAARVNCLDFARKGEPRSAELCFNQQAAGGGLTAEMALYEMARLRRDVLRDATGALGALDEYRQRFPRGTLRNEVNISRVELLSQLGRGREALRESEALLDSASGRERAAELHVLRGNVFRHDLADLAAAILEYAQAEPFGGSLGAEASRLRGMSLESLGDREGALAAYRRYLQSPDQPRRADVLRRVQALGASQPRGATP
jgi:hypothetical protein